MGELHVQIGLDYDSDREEVPLIISNIPTVVPVGGQDCTTPHDDREEAPLINYNHGNYGSPYTNTP